MPEIVRFIMLSLEFLAAIQDGEGGTYLPRYVIDVFLVFVRYYNLKVGGSWPSYGIVANESGHTRRTVANAIRILRNKGYLKAIGKRGKSILYDINMNGSGVVLGPFNPPPTPVNGRHMNTEQMATDDKTRDGNGRHMDTNNSRHMDQQQSPYGDTIYIEEQDITIETDFSCPDSENRDFLSEEDSALLSLFGYQDEELETLVKRHGPFLSQFLINQATACIDDLFFVLRLSDKASRDLRVTYDLQPADLIRHLLERGNGDGSSWVRVSRLLENADESEKRKLITDYRDKPDDLIERLTAEKTRGATK